MAWLNAARRAPGEPRFPGLKAIAMVEACVERGGKTTIARRFFLSSLPLDAPLLAALTTTCLRHFQKPDLTRTRPKANA
ncbi:MAG: hypothetical protein LW703_13595 [Rhodobacter sp.]|nr:hypothetical protein [Rhodobacter sp.]